MSSSTFPTSMKAARLVQFNKAYKIEDVPVPKIGDNELLVKVAAAGFCHTDYQVFEGVYESKLPMTPSHESVGTVVQVGAVASQKWKVGQRVGLLNFRHACGSCFGCKNYREGASTNVQPDTRFCVNKDMAGISGDGDFAEYIVADANTTNLLPDNMPFDQAAPLMCAGATVWAGIAAAELNHEAKEPVAVIGIGGLGQLAIQFLKALGHPTLAIDNRSEGLALAKEAGPFNLRADLVIDYNDSDATEKCLQFDADKGGVAAAVVCTDNTEANEWSLTILRPRGVSVVLGLPVDGFHFNAFDLVFKELKVRGSLVANKEQVGEMMSLVAKHGVESYITTVPFEKVPQFPELYMDKQLKGRLVLTM